MWKVKLNNMTPKIKKILHLIGGGLGLSGIIFVTIKLNTYAADIDFKTFDTKVWIILVLGILFYGYANVFLSFAWKNLVTYLRANITSNLAIKIYGVSQLAKYLPGNIIHLAGRQSLGMGAGISALVLAKSTVWELVSLAVAGSVFMILTIPLIVSINNIFFWIAFALVFFLAQFVIKKLISVNCQKAFNLQSLFLAISGLIFVLILSSISSVDISVIQMPAVCAGFVVAWLIGFVTPGAPAGVGVREMVLIFLLKGIVIEADLLVAVVLGRIVTVLGDLLFFFFAFFKMKVEN